MDDLIERIEALLRRYVGINRRVDVAALDYEMIDRFRAEVRLLVAEYGPAAVDAALEAIPYDRSLSLH